MKTTKVLVVCHGNINRSALAGVVLREEGVDVRSRGIRQDCRGKATLKMREIATDNGYDLDAHRAQPVAPGDLEWADVILFMDGGNLRHLEEMGASAKKLMCLTSFDPIVESLRPKTVRDPNFWKRGDPRIAQVAAQIIRCCKTFAAQTS